MTTLKACPFCGRTDYLASMPWHNGGRVGYLVGCIFLNCVRPHVYGDNEIVATRTWNTRPEEDRRRALLREALDIINDCADHSHGCSRAHGENYRCRCNWVLQKETIDRIRKEVG